VDKEALTRGGAGPVGLPEGDAEIPGIGTVRVRGMNRGEVLHGNKLNESGGQLALERYVLSSCMLDPRMTEDDVAAWQESGAAMECQPVLHRINELSGIGKGAEKSGVPGDGDES
jgi:hypothetical protein